MRRISFAVAAALALSTADARAVATGPPPVAPEAVRHLPTTGPALAPIRYVMFCLQYPRECRPRRTFRGGPVTLTARRWTDLVEVNRAVNRGIVPERNTGGLAAEEWLIDPPRGDCNDYAVSKRHHLMARGWPARTLLLAEVEVRSGEHHLVLVARTRSGDLVLDNLNWNVVQWSRAPYRWVRTQSPANPRYWMRAAERQTEVAGPR